MRGRLPPLPNLHLKYVRRRLTIGFRMQTPDARVHTPSALLSPPSWNRGKQVPESNTPSVTLYTHPDCAFSAAAKMEYRKRKVPYVDVDLSKQTDQIPALLALTGGERVTPVIVEDGTVTIGFKGGT